MNFLQYNQGLHSDGTATAANSSSTLLPLMADSDDFSESDDDSSVSSIDDEEETRVAHLLVQAAFNKQLSPQTSNALFQNFLEPISNKTIQKQQTQTNHPVSTSNNVIGQKRKREPQKQQQQEQKLQEAVNAKPDDAENSSAVTNQPSKDFRFARPETQQVSPFKSTFSVTSKIQNQPALTAAAVNANQRQQQEEAPTLSSPQSHLFALLAKAGLPTHTYSALALSKTGVFFEPVTHAAIAAYNADLGRAVRDGDVSTIKAMVDKRTSTTKEPQMQETEREQKGASIERSGVWRRCTPRNQFGESVIHTAARHGTADVLRFLLDEAGASAAVCCDSGRTPLHDACWTCRSQTSNHNKNDNFDLSDHFPVIEILLGALPDLLYIKDQRGFTPLQYVPVNQWSAWHSFLDARYGPSHSNQNLQKLRSRRLPSLSTQPPTLPG